MLEIVIEGREGFNEETQEFVAISGQRLMLEHSLISLSKWESKWNKPFMSKESRTVEETLDYIKCMTINQNIPDEIYMCLTPEHISKVQKYIESPMTATTFRKDGNGQRSNEVITSELIYYWMIALNIPFECQKWHLNRLLTLIRVCSIKNAPSKKMGKNELLARNKALNAERRQRLNSKG